MKPLPVHPAAEANGPRIIMETIPLSVAIITMNEADNLPHCLESVAFADQIVVVDSGSTDDTRDIATGFGCHVFVEEWRGFGRQKQAAIDHCSHRWVLLLDADERIPPAAASVIRQIVLSDSDEAAGYRFPRMNFFQGRWMKHIWGGDRVVRLFQKSRSAMTNARVHEAVEVDGPVRDLDVPIEHYTESNLSKLLLKIDHYSTLGAQEAFDEGKKASAWTAAVLACLAFFQSYFLKLGVLDGHQGLTLSITESVNKFFKYAKLYQLCRRHE
ncbi:MAG: glycosyltransferase family 2 protein [Deltaproteobacteria bacterium]|nr:glycosyltransferase family 2 protein [Deltaproteobacteria bacterium]